LNTNLMADVKAGPTAGERVQERIQIHQQFK